MTTLSIFEFVVLSGVAVFYIARVLSWESSSIGPFKSNTASVIEFHFGEESGDYSKTERPVNLFDRIRRFFGVYSITSNYWTPIEKNLEVWLCHKCLSFWVTFPFSITYIFLYPGDWRYVPIIHFAIAGISYVVYEYVANQSA